MAVTWGNDTGITGQPPTDFFKIYWNINDANNRPLYTTGVRLFASAGTFATPSSLPETMPPVSALSRTQFQFQDGLKPPQFGTVSSITNC
jgi:hypothetical protein